MEFRRKRRDGVAMDITPMVDMVFLLLTFFMLSTTFIVSPGIRINLPRASVDAVRTESQDLHVKIDSQGTLFLEGEPVSPQGLEEQVRAAGARSPDMMVVIEADETTQHKYVVEVMDRVKSAGLHRMAIATRPKE